MPIEKTGIHAQYQFPSYSILI